MALEHCPQVYLTIQGVGLSTGYLTFDTFDSDLRDKLKSSHKFPDIVFIFCKSSLWDMLSKALRKSRYNTSVW